MPLISMVIPRKSSPNNTDTRSVQQYKIGIPRLVHDDAHTHHRNLFQTPLEKHLKCVDRYKSSIKSRHTSEHAKRFFFFARRNNTEDEDKVHVRFPQMLYNFFPSLYIIILWLLLIWEAKKKHATVCHRTIPFRIIIFASTEDNPF